MPADFASTQIKDLKKIAQQEAHEPQPSVRQDIGSLHGGEAVGILQNLTINHNNAPIQASANDPYHKFIEALNLPQADSEGFLERCKRGMTPGTCEWLREDEPKFEEWIEGNSRILWVIGGPGTGKTMLSVSNIDHIQAQIRRREALASQENKQSHRPDTLAYCFCNPTQANTMHAITGSLLRQLIYNHRNLLPTLVSERAVNDGDQLFAVFKQVLRRLEEHFRHIYIILDGVDECDVKEGKKLVGSLLGLANEGDMKTKLLATSQDEVWIVGNLDASKVPQIRIRASNIAGDVKKTIEHQIEVAHLDARIGSQWQEKLENYLLENTQDTFLWASFVIKNFEEYTSDDLDFDRMIAEIPSEIYDAYDRMMRRIYRRVLDRVFTLDEVNFVLQLVSVAKRDLTKEEINMAFGIWKRKTAGGSKVVPDLNHMRSMAYKSCSPLVSVDEETQVVYLMHRSVAKYLGENRPRVVWDERFGGTPHQPSFQIDQSRANFLVLDVCLWFLDTCGINSDEEMSRYEREFVQVLDLESPDSEEREQEKKAPVFLSYARKYWQDHALDIMDRDQAIHELRKLPNISILRDRLLLCAAERGHDKILRILLKEMGASPNVAERDGKTALHIAAFGGHVDAVQLLVDHGVDLHQKDSAGATALHWAAGGGKLNTVTQLFRMHQGRQQTQTGQTVLSALCAPAFLFKRWFLRIPGLVFGPWKYTPGTESTDGSSAVDVEMPDEKGGTLLAWALENGSKEVVEFLLANGAKTDIRYFRHPGRTVVNRTDPITTLHSLLELFEDLLEITPVKRVRGDLLQRTPLARAAERGLGQVVELLLDYGADPNFKDVSDRAPVWWAAKNRHGGVVKTLKRRGADCNSQLRLAVLRKEIPAIKTLLENEDVDPNWEDEIGLSHVGWAAVGGDKDVMEALLEDGRTDTESKAATFRITPLGLAAWFGESEVIGPLLARGANVNWVDETDSTPLMWAVRKGSTEAVKRLLESGNANIGWENQMKRTALMVAAMIGKEAVFNLLVEPEKNLNRRDAFGRPAIFSAIRGGHRQIIDKMLSAPELDTWTPDFYGSTCLSIAARFGDTSTILKLLSRGNHSSQHNSQLTTQMDPICRRDNFGRSPMAWAMRTGQSQTMTYLLSECKRRKLPTGGDESIPLKKLSPNKTAGSQTYPHPFCDVCLFNVGGHEMYYTCHLCFSTKGSFVCCQECWDSLRPPPTCLNPRHKLYLKRKEDDGG